MPVNIVLWDENLYHSLLNRDYSDRRNFKSYLEYLVIGSTTTRALIIHRITLNHPFLMVCVVTATTIQF